MSVPVKGLRNSGRNALRCSARRLGERLSSARDTPSNQKPQATPSPDEIWELKQVVRKLPDELAKVQAESLARYMSVQERKDERETEG